MSENGDKATVEWHRVLEPDGLPEGRVTTVAAGYKSVALVHYEGQFSALDNHCPHQGGPLGEGSIENGLLRCPWHGFDYCPLDGQVAGVRRRGHRYPLEIRDGEVFVGVEPPAPRTHGHRRDGRDDGQLGRRARLRHGRPLQPRPRRRAAPPGGGRQPHLHRHPPRGRRRLRRLGLRQADRQARRVPDDRRARRHQPAHGLWDAKVDRAPVLALTGQVDTQVLGPGAFQEVDPRGAFELGRLLEPAGAPDSKPVELMNLACKNAMLRRDVAHLIFPDKVQTLPAPEEPSRAPGGAAHAERQITPPAEQVDRARRSGAREGRSAR